MCVGYAQACVITGHVSVSLLAPPEARLAPAEERRHALLVVLGQARQRELVDVHVACEIVERMRQAIDGELGHRDRQRRLRRGLFPARYFCSDSS